MNINNKSLHSKLLILSIGLIIFLAANVFMALNALHIIRDIDSAECCHASLAHMIDTGHDLKIIMSELGDNFNGGGYLAGILPFSIFYALISYIFTNSYLTLKLTPLIFHTLTFLILGCILAKNFKTKALLVFCIFYAFAPLYMYKWNLTFWASHPESSFFTALLLYLYLTKKRLFLLGLVAGISFYLSYFCLPVIAAFIIYDKLIDKKSLKFFAFQFLPGFIIGFSPWIMFRYCNSPEMAIEEKKLTMFIPSFTNLFTKTITAIFNAPFFGPVLTDNNLLTSELIKYIQHSFFIFFILISLTSLIKYFSFSIKQKQIIQIISAAIIFHFAAVILSGHNKEIYDIASEAPRYFVALFPLFFFIGSVFTAYVFKISKGVFSLAIITILLYTATNIYDYTNFMKLGHKNAYKTYKGLNYYFKSINSVPLAQSEEINKAIELLKDTPVYFGFATVFYKHSEARYKTLPNYSENVKTNAEIIKDLREETLKIKDQQKRKYFLEGFGYGLAIKHNWRLKISENFINRYASPEDVPHLIQGLQKAFSSKKLYV